MKKVLVLLLKWNGSYACNTIEMIRISCYYFIHIISFHDSHDQDIVIIDFFAICFQFIIDLRRMFRRSHIKGEYLH